MTRETKIGLLVGLAFIIVIGILLSDHLSTTTEPPRAPLAQAGDTVRQGVGLPSNPTPPPITVVPPVSVAPQQPVMTREDLNKPVLPPVIPQSPVQPQQAQRGAGDSQLEQIARQVGEELIPANAHRPEPVNPQPQQVQPQPQQPPVQPPVVVANREYKAEEGDSVSRMAMKFFGVNNKQSRQAIIDANPSLKVDANRVIVGRTYVIPASLTAPATPGTPVQTANVQKSNKQPVSSPEYWYTVKDNDNLWKIAYEQLGNGNAWVAIKELNKDVLKGDTVQPNMRLRLPAKPLASAR